MTGPEHYLKAEEALTIFEVEREPAAWAEAMRNGELALAAQVATAHATLALAAATALNDHQSCGDPSWDPMGGLPDRDAAGWRRVAATPKPVPTCPQCGAGAGPADVGYFCEPCYADLAASETKAAAS